MGIHRQKAAKRNNLTSASDFASIFGFSILTFSFAFLVSFLIGSHFAPTSDSSAAGDINVTNVVTGYYANITSSSSVVLNIDSTPDGAYKVGKDTLSIDTNAKDGYKLYISTIDHSSDNPRLPNTTPANGLIDGTGSSFISPSTGTINAPVRLETNTWGYTVSKATSSDTSVSYVDSDAAPNEEDGGKSVWMGVPVYGSENVLYTNTTPLTSSTNSVDVYYAANASTSLPSGTYSNIVVYTAIVDGGISEDGSTDVSISPISQEGLSSGQQVTIATGLYPGFNTDNLGTISVKIGDNDCTNITPVITEIGSLNLTCIVPAQTNYSKYTVTVKIEKYGKTYTLTDGYSYMVYQGNIPEFYTITTMQQMTHDICYSNKVVTPTLSTMANIITKDNVTPFSVGTPQTTLTDSRDGKTYTIRKLPDGKCWMTRNLRYAPSTATTLSSGSSDILSANTWQMPALGTDNSGNTDYNGDEVYEGSYGATYDATYYSWHTATAGTGTSSMTSGNTTQSICPKNWRLPTGGDGNGTTGITTTGSTTNVVNGDFKQLDIAFGGTGADGQGGGRANWTNTTYGFSAALIGAFVGSSAYYGGTYGYWWSSSVDSDTDAYRLRMDASVMYPQNTRDKVDSFAVRCVAR